MHMDQLTWSEFFALISVIISFATICVNSYSRAKADTKNEQKMFDKLDNLAATSAETRDAVKLMDAKLDDHSMRITRIEGKVENLTFRIKRVEETSGSIINHYKKEMDQDG